MVKMSTSNSSLNRVISEQQFNDARAKTAVLYKLTKVMLRLGSFDHLFKLQLAGMQVIHTVTAKDINYSSPTGKDAEKVIKLGLNNASTPNLSGYYDGQWVHYTPEMRMNLYKDTVLTAGMSLVRHSIYY
jgi:hypothetical protein